MVTVAALVWLHVVVVIFAMLLLAVLHNSCTRRATLMSIMIART